MELVDGGTLRDLLREDGAAVRAGHPVHPRAAAGRAGHRARGRPGAPGHQAGERADLRQGRGEDRRLRPGQGGHLADHGHRRRHPRHRRLPVPRAGRHRFRRRALGRLRRRHRGLGDAHRPSAVHRRQRHVGGLPARPLRRPAGLGRSPGGTRGARGPDPGRHQPRTADRPRDAAAFLSAAVGIRARLGLRRVPVPVPHRQPYEPTRGAGGRRPVRPRSGRPRRPPCPRPARSPDPVAPGPCRPCGRSPRNTRRPDRAPRAGPIGPARGRLRPNGAGSGDGCAGW